MVAQKSLKRIVNDEWADVLLLADDIKHDAAGNVLQSSFYRQLTAKLLLCEKRIAALRVFIIEEFK